MQYVWHHRLWLAGDLKTSSGESVSVIDVGQLNRDAGPDFFNAKVRIGGGEVWCGNVEIHVRASDWHRHGHDGNPAYDNTVLHVVAHDDCPIYTTDGRLIPQVTMACARNFQERYAEFVHNPANTLACAAEIGQLSPVVVRDWLDALAFERIYEKVEAIERRLERFGGDWEQAAFITLARALGAGVNGDAFERVAASVPLRFLRKHCDSLLSLESLLFGQAGLLDGPSPDGYVEQLKREYAFLAGKFGLGAPVSPGWRMSRMRPASFPHRRIATLAHMVYGGFKLMGRIIDDVNNEEDARALFRTELTGYWTDHFNFSAPTPRVTPQAFGHGTIDMLVINVVAPLMLAYGNYVGDETASDRAVDILEHLPGEKNRYTADFAAAGVSCPNAFVSQAMVQLHKSYCDVRKCLYCRLGHRLLAAKVKP